MAIPRPEGPLSQLLSQLPATWDAVDALSSGNVVSNSPSVNARIAVYVGTSGTEIADGGSTIADIVAGSGGLVTSVFGRTGAIVAATNDYTWAQVNKTTSSLADITTRSASDLSSGTLPAARMPALTGDVTTSAGAVATTIANNAVSLAKMGDIATASFLGRNTAGTGDPEVLSVATAKTMLGVSGTNSGDVTLAGENYLSIAGQVITANAVNLGNTNVTGTLTANKGGTGQSSYTIGDLLYASGTTALSKLADVATGNALISGGVGAAPSWGKIDLTTHVSNVLPVANGGTGQSTYTNGQLLIGNTTGNTLTKATLTGTTNQVVVTNGTGSITLSLPQDIHTGASPSFVGLTLSGNANISGFVGHPSYVSQTTQWRIDNTGGADFRYLFVDEMHAKSFIVDLEQALAGGQIITKSVGVLGANFTAPAAGGTATLTIRDLPSAPNMAAFESGDYVRLRTFSRAAGSLTIDDCWGIVTAYTDQAGGLQTWTFTRGSGANAGSMTSSTVVQADAIVLDYGVTGNGFYEVNAIDGVYGINSPYAQIVTWTTSPIAANQVLRTRFGNLRGITGTTNEYGMIAGSYAGTNGQYFRASNSAFELHGINLLMWDGSTNVIKLDRTAPSFAIGSPVPSAYGTGTGIWMGKDSGAYKFRVGVPGGGGLFWDGTTMTVAGWTVNAASFAQDTGTNATSSGMAPADFPFFAGATVANRATAPFRVTPAGALTATSATITGSITATSGAIAGWTIGSTALSSGTTYLASGFDPPAGQISWFGKAAAGFQGWNLRDSSNRHVGAFVGTGTEYPYMSIYDGTHYRVVLGSLNQAFESDGATNSIGMKIWNSSGTKLVEFSTTQNIISGWTIAATKISSTGIDINSGASAGLAFGTTPPTSASAGTGIWLDRTGLYGLASSVLQIKVGATDGKFTAGNLQLSSNGIEIASSTTKGTREYKFVDSLGGTYLGGMYSTFAAGSPADFSLILEAFDTGGGVNNSILIQSRGVTSEIKLRNTTDTGTARDEVVINGGIQVGTQASLPGGGAKGLGTINTSGDIYKNGTAFLNPDFVFEHWATGKIEKFAHKDGASDYKGLRPLSEVREFVRSNYHLPGFGQKAGHGLFSGGDQLLLTVEQMYLHIFELEQEIKELKGSQWRQEN